MKIIYRKRFLKQFKKLEHRHQLAVHDVIDRFRHNPFDPDLDNHPLKGNLKGKRAITAGFDLRVIFEEQGNYTVVVMLAVGTHEKVY